MAVSVTELIRFLVRGGLLSALKAATGSALRPLARELTIATDALSMRVGTGSGEYDDLPVLNPVGPAFQFRTKTSSTTDADPGNGFVKWNNGTHASATILYFDLLTSNTGTDLTTFFASLGVGVNSSGLIKMTLEEDRSKWQLWRWTSITTATGYRKFAVVLQASTGTFGDNLAMRVQFMAPMPTGVTANTYTSADITVGPDGRIYAAANGTGGAASGWTLVKKTVDEQRLNTTTPSSDAELFVDLLAGKTYHVVIWIMYTAATATPDIKVTNAYSGTITSWLGIRKAVNPAGSPNEVVGVENALLTNGAFATTGTGFAGFIKWECALVTNTAGRLAFQFSQNTSDAVTPVIVKAGSYIAYAQFN